MDRPNLNSKLEGQKLFAKVFRNLEEVKLSKIKALKCFVVKF